MACGGPSKDYAYELGEEAFWETLNMLMEKYNVHEPHVYSNAVFDSDSPMEHNIKVAVASKSRHDKIVWDKNTEKLKHLIQEIIWNDHANGF